MRVPPIKQWVAWPTPNYTDPQTTGPGLVITNIVFMTLCVIAVTLRIYARRFVQKQFGWDDIAIVIALFFAVSLGICSSVANVRYGWDVHDYDLPLVEFTYASICAMVAKLLFTLAATFTRMSLICFYYRLVKDSNIGWFQMALHASMVLNVVVCLVFIFFTVFICNPVESYWVFPIMPGSTCLNEGTVTLSAGITNCFCDLECTLLPLPIIWNLHLPIRQRLAVMALLTIGIIVTLAGISRTFFIWKSLVESWDETWYSFPLWISACVEVDLAVLCACAPSLKPLFTRLSTRLATSLSSLASRIHPNSAHTSPESTVVQNKSSGYGTPADDASRGKYRSWGHIATWLINTVNDEADESTEETAATTEPCCDLGIARIELQDTSTTSTRSASQTEYRVLTPDSDRPGSVSALDDYKHTGPFVSSHPLQREESASALSFHSWQLVSGAAEAKESV